jgi:hypothetical protein
MNNDQVYLMSIKKQVKTINELSKIDGQDSKSKINKISQSILNSIDEKISDHCHCGNKKYKLDLCIRCYSDLILSPNER